MDGCRTTVWLMLVILDIAFTQPYCDLVFLGLDELEWRTLFICC